MNVRVHSTQKIHGTSALREFNYSKTLNPKEPMSYICMADAYYCLGQIELADRCCKKAVELDPDDLIAKKNFKKWRGVVQKREYWGKRYSQPLQQTGIIPSSSDANR